MGAESINPPEMADIRPFMMNAYVEWIVASNCTPHVLVLAQGARVPSEHVKEGKITLNVSPSAVRNFSITDNGMSFNCRFGGRDFPVYAPLDNIELVYARENGEGCYFLAGGEGVDISPEEPPNTEKSSSKERPPFLKVVK